MLIKFNIWLCNKFSLEFAQHFELVKLSTLKYVLLFTGCTCGFLRAPWATMSICGNSTVVLAFTFCTMILYVKLLHQLIYIQNCTFTLCLVFQNKVSQFLILV